MGLLKFLSSLGSSFKRGTQAGYAEAVSASRPSTAPLLPADAVGPHADPAFIAAEKQMRFEVTWCAHVSVYTALTMWEVHAFWFVPSGKNRSLTLCKLRAAGFGPFPDELYPKN